MGPERCCTPTWQMRPFTREFLFTLREARMRALVSQAMQEGALGVASSLSGPPGRRTWFVVPKHISAPFGRRPGMKHTSSASMAARVTMAIVALFALPAFAGSRGLPSRCASIEAVTT